MKHNSETKHNVNVKDSKILVKIHNEQHRKFVESSFIFNYDTFKQTLDSLSLSPPPLVELILNNYNITSPD